MKLVFSTLLFCLLALSSTGCKKQEIKETFFGESSDELVALYGAKGGLLAPIPSCGEAFVANSLAETIVVLTKISKRKSNNKDDVIGIATELEVIKQQENGLFSDSEWTVKIPGRGSLFLTQVENLNYIKNIVSDLNTNGENTKSFNPPFEVITTVAGTGKIVGGTKEFKNIYGTFIEKNILHYLNTKSRKIEVDVELEITYEIH
jgi:hypothetical protein